MGTPPTTPPTVDPNEIQTIKSALDADITDAGVGLYHIPTNRVYLSPSSQTNPVGHTALAMQIGLDAIDCRGFVVAKIATSGQFTIENISGLNVGSGGNGLGMPNSLFDSIKQTLIASGL